MRKVIFSILGVTLLALFACQSKDTPEPSIEQKLAGRWKIEVIIEEFYKPVNTLVESELTHGRDGDAVEFKPNGVLYVYSEIDGDDETTYEILNDTTIRIEDEVYVIKKLVDAELVLEQDHTEPGANERFVQKIIFVR
jgi:predicted nucleotidyltransferase